MEHLLGLFLLLSSLVKDSIQFKDAARLYNDLLRDTNITKVRPIYNHSVPLRVYIGLRLSQLMDVVITTNIWLEHEWVDEFMRWNPDDYGGVTMMYIPAEQLWLPDVVLNNNADGSYIVTIMTPANVFYNGSVKWSPPAVFKSSCIINVEFFPFDIQECNMTFTQWTTDCSLMELCPIVQKFVGSEAKTIKVDYAVDLKDYYSSVEFDLLEFRAESHRNKYDCCQHKFMDVTFYMTMRRKTLFYTVNLIMPCVAIALLTLLVFYLPSQSGEKISLSINIMLSLTVFFLLLAETIPPTGLAMPLIGKYLLFTMILVSLSIVVTVIVLNVHSSENQEMSTWVRVLFLHILPKLLMMQRPWVVETVNPMETESDEEDYSPPAISVSLLASNKDNFRGQKVTANPCNFSLLSKRISTDLNLELESASHRRSHEARRLQHQVSSRVELFFDLPEDRSERKKLLHIHRFLRNIRTIAKHLQAIEKKKSIQDDWKYVAMVLDRLFLWIFSIACVVGTIGIVLQAPTFYDKRQALDKGTQPENLTVEFENQTISIPLATLA